MKLPMDLLMKLLIKSDWRGVFVQYLIDFLQKTSSLKNNSPPCPVIKYRLVWAFLLTEAILPKSLLLKNLRYSSFSLKRQILSYRCVFLFGKE